MQLFKVFLVFLFSWGVIAKQESTKHGYVMSFKPNCPDNIMQKVQQTVREKGGVITYVSNLIKMFAFEMPDVQVATVKASVLDQEDQKWADVEKDQEVHILKDRSSP